MNGSPLAIRKLIVGILALGCLATAGGVFFFTVDGLKNPVMAYSTRLGIMLGALWLALPSSGESLVWLKILPVVLVVAVVCVRGGGRVLLWAIPLAIVAGIVIAIIRPKKKRR